MSDVDRLIHLLRNTAVREIIKALERDNFYLRRMTPTGGNIYSHADGRMTVVHYHRSGDTLTRKTLHSMLVATDWTEDDLKRLGLVK